MVAMAQKLVNGILTTPERPLDLPMIDLTDNARQVLLKRYVRRGVDGKPAETIEDMFWRVAYHVAKVESFWDSDVIAQARKFYHLLISKSFFPNSPTFTGAGTPLGQLAACFVLPITDDMGKDQSGIFQTLRDAALIQQTGGGNGFNFSRIRPHGSRVATSAGQATGPVGFLRVYDNAFGEIAQGGTRRGANMAVLRVDHPDIEDFVSCKTSENAITNFNISVGITDAFMEAVEKDGDWPLRFPNVKDKKYREIKGTLNQMEKAGVEIITEKTINARELFNQIVKQAHHNGEPGMLFLDAANRANPVPHLYELEATNPCGEQWLGAYENCCLGSVNLAQDLGVDGTVDWVKLGEDVATATRFLDDVVDANNYVPAVPQLAKAAHRARRIGLGIMGLADLMYHCGIRYGSAEGQEFAAQVMEYVRYISMKTSVELSQERGPFAAIEGSIYDPANFTFTAPTPLEPYTYDFDRPSVDWEELVTEMKLYGIRNAAQTTIAPTGTIATVAGCEGYGCEPTFALAYIRHVNDNGNDLQLKYASPLFEKALNLLGLDEDTKQRIIDETMNAGSCQDIIDLPVSLRNTFVVSADITAEEHVRTQAAMQRFVDNSLSKTINFPEGATEEDVAKAYQLAWKLGCKGITVYVTGSRDKVVLETHATAKQKQVDEGPAPLADEKSKDEQITIWHETKKPRPRFLTGYTYSIETPLGKAFITVNENSENQPFEVFINTAKAGSDTAAVSEAIGRMISYVLRLASPIEPAKRMREMTNQLLGIGGGRPLGFGAHRVRSLPDGVGQILDEYMQIRAERLATLAATPPPAKPMSDAGLGKSQGLTYMVMPQDAPKSQLKFGDLCPECGEAAVINEEGCRKCYACGYSEC